jgi:hypothetical protein
MGQAAGPTGLACQVVKVSAVLPSFKSNDIFNTAAPRPFPECTLPKWIFWKSVSTNYSLF